VRYHALAGYFPGKIARMLRQAAYVTIHVWRLNRLLSLKLLSIATAAKARTKLQESKPTIPRVI
jgi:hypothetical protein